MIIMISENDQIIGADQEFIGDSTLDTLRENFPSMSVFVLQSENGTFEFEYNDKNYSVQKLPIIMVADNANVFYFNEIGENKLTNNENNSPIIEEKSVSPDFGLSRPDEAIQTDPIKENSTELELDLGNSLSFEPESTQQNNSLSINNNENSFDLGLSLPDETPTQSEPIKENSTELELDLGNSLSFKPEESTQQNNSLSINDNENSLDLGLSLPDETPTQSEPIKENSTELELDFGFDDDTVDLKLSKDDITISPEEIQIDLKQASSDLGIDDETIQSFFNDFKQQLIEEEDVFFNSIKNNDFDTIHKSAHKLKGVALNLRLNKFGELLRNIDDLAKHNLDMDSISKIIENVYNVIDNKEKKVEEKISIFDEEIPKEEIKIIAKSFINFLENLKDKDLEITKKELKNSYGIVPIKVLKESENISSNEDMIKFISNLEENLKKEMK